MGLQAASDLLLASDAPLKGIDHLVWESLAEAALSSEHPWNHGFFSTLACRGDSELIPKTRTVILRNVDRAMRALDCYTDVRSAKVRQLNEGSKETSWAFYDADSKIQLRVSGTTEVIDDATADIVWRNTPLRNRVSYLSIDSPGKEVTENQPPDLRDRVTSLSESERGRQNFRILRTTVKSIDWLYLRPAGHVRARLRYDSKGEPATVWLVP